MVSVAKLCAVWGLSICLGTTCSEASSKKELYSDITTACFSIKKITAINAVRYSDSRRLACMIREFRDRFLYETANNQDLFAHCIFHTSGWAGISSLSLWGGSFLPPVLIVEAIKHAYTHNDRGRRNRFLKCPFQFMRCTSKTYGHGCGARCSGYFSASLRE